MRKLIFRLIGTALSFYLTSQLIGGFQLQPTIQTYFTASILFILINTLIKPIIKLLLLPINLLTLGLFSWLVNVLVLYLFDFIYPGIHITAYDFPGYTSPLLSLPPQHLSLFWVLVLSSFFISLFYSLYQTIFK